MRLESMRAEEKPAAFFPDREASVWAVSVSIARVFGRHRDAVNATRLSFSGWFARVASSILGTIDGVSAETRKVFQRLGVENVPVGVILDRETARAVVAAEDLRSENVASDSAELDPAPLLEPFGAQSAMRTVRIAR